MYCKHCGIIIADDSIFCSKCGTKQSYNIELEPSNTNYNGNLNSQNKTGSKTQVKKIEISFSKPFPSLYKTENNEFGKYDKTYKSDNGPIIAGILSILFFCFILLDATFIHPQVESETFKINAYISIVTRIGFSIWCYRIASSLNRKPETWLLLALFFPAITLIVIGTRRKLLYNESYFNLPDEKKSTVNDNLAIDLINIKQYQEALKFSDKSMELNPMNHAALYTRGKIKYNLHDFNGALNDFQKSIELNPNHAVKFYHRGLVYKALNDNENAIKDWEVASNMGLKDAEIALKENVLG